MKPVYAKPPLPIDAQLNLLESRGMTIEDREFATRALATISYYRLSAYSFPYRSSNHPDHFVPGTTFSKVWNAYRFDRRLRSVVLDGPGIPIKDPRWHERRYPIVPHRIYSVLCILKQLIDVIAPQSRWDSRFAGLLAEFPDIHRLSMALPTGFEKSLIWR